MPAGVCFRKAAAAGGGCLAGMVGNDANGAPGPGLSNLANGTEGQRSVREEGVCLKDLSKGGTGSDLCSRKITLTAGLR